MVQWRIRSASGVLGKLAQTFAPQEGPIDQRFYGRSERQAHLAERILNLRRHLRIDRPGDDAVLLQLLELLDQHLLVHALDAALEFRKTHRRFGRKELNDYHIDLPFPLEHPQRLARRGCPDKLLFGVLAPPIALSHAYLSVGIPPAGGFLLNLHLPLVPTATQQIESRDNQ